MEDEPLLAPRDNDSITQDGQGELPKQAIIVDLDGTLADIGDRSPYNTDEVMYDKLNKVIYRLIMKYKRDGYHILVVTGRPIACSTDTIEWLNMNHVPFDMLVMRPEGDKQQDITLKHRAYNQYIKNEYDVEFVLEDRSRVVRMWRSIGLICFQVKDGDF